MLIRELAGWRRDAGEALLRLLDEEGLRVRALYWRRAGPGPRWVLALALAEFEGRLEPGLTRLIDAVDEAGDRLWGLSSLDLHLLRPDDSELAEYGRLVGRHHHAEPRIFRGTRGASRELPAALIYRLLPPTPMAQGAAGGGP